MPLTPAGNAEAWRDASHEWPNWNCESCGEEHDECDCEGGPESPYPEEDDRPKRRRDDA